MRSRPKGGAAPRGSSPGGSSLKRSIATAGLVATLFVAASPAIAQADEGSPFNFIGQATPKIAVYPYSYNSQWQPGMDAALANWNATYSPVALTKSTSSTSTVTAASYSASWFGYYQACGSTCLYIRLNSSQIAPKAINMKNFVTSVLAHEYGHALNLGHRPGEDSIMNSTTRNRDTMVNPSSSDVTNVIRAYPSWALS